MKLWQKDYKANEAIVNFCVGEDYLLDQKLVGYDVKATIVHCAMLKKIRILNKKEFTKIKNCLKEIIKLTQKKGFVITKTQEDCHTAIENYLVKQLGVLGKKIHTGGSRNDQVLTALRLYAKDKLQQIAYATVKLAQTILKFAQKHEFVPMPGFSHTRRAMPSSIGLWAGAFTESLIDDLYLLKTAYDLNNQCPLGSAAGFGVSLPIDRDFTTKMLGFKKTQKNTLYVQNSRGKFESVIIDALSQIMLDLNRLASDLIYFTNEANGYFILPKEFCTGSSLMPNKQNPDGLEIVRANYKVVLGCVFTIKNLLADLLSGYNRDYQLAKEPFIKAIEITLSSLEIMVLVISSLIVNRKKCGDAITPDMFATDGVMELVNKGIPFRKAYSRVAKELKQLKPQDSLKNIKIKTHIGAPGNLGLNNLKEKLAIIANDFT